VAALFMPSAPKSAAAAPGVTFAHEVTIDPQRADGEPDLALANNGTDMYASTPWGFSTSVSFAWKSTDSGVQWYNLHGSSACATGAELRPDCSRGGGDTEIQLSAPQGTGNTKQTVQFVDLNGLDTLSCAYSTDGGDTFVDLPGANVAGQVCNLAIPSGTLPGSDRQWIAVCPQTAPCAGTGATADKL
jgi:hypothetical protein